MRSKEKQGRGLWHECRRLKFADVQTIDKKKDLINKSPIQHAQILFISNYQLL